MARFEGTNEEFKRYVGPRLRNVVQQITRRQKAINGHCQFCGSSTNLEAAHIHGRERVEIIDSLFDATSDEAKAIELENFEESFRSEHEPFEKTILVLCHDCHQKYDGQKGKYLLPITLDPPVVNDFKSLLLQKRAAEIRIIYRDGQDKVLKEPLNNAAIKTD